jgi:hypothetical protein
VDDKRIQLLKLASAFLASDGRLDKMSHMREVFESERVYESIFNEKRLKAHPRDVIVV